MTVIQVLLLVASKSMQLFLTNFAALFVMQFAERM